MYPGVIRVNSKLSLEHLLERAGEPENDGKSPSYVITCSGVEIPGWGDRFHDNEASVSQAQGSFWEDNINTQKREKREQDDESQFRNLSTERRDGLPVFFFFFLSGFKT